MATGLMLAVIVVSTPEILSAGFWRAPESDAALAPVAVADAKANASAANISVADAASLVPVEAVVPPMPEMLRPSIADSGKAALPLLRETADSAVTSRRKIRIAQTPAKMRVTKAPVAKAPAVKVAAHAKPHRLPPIGEAY